MGPATPILGRSISLLLLLGFFLTCCGAADNPRAQLLQELIFREGSSYIALRDDLLSRGDELRPFLNHTVKNSQDWRQTVTASILLGWLDNSEQYKELWNWQVTPSQRRNPFPYYYREAHAKFSQAGASAIPVMLELIWKKQQSHHGALPAVLADLKVESALPILVQMKYGFPQAVGQFGCVAISHVLQVLPSAEATHRAWLVQALGLTGCDKAVAELRSRLNTDQDRSTRQAAAVALGQLRQYDILRSSYSQTQENEARLVILKALSQDKSDETRALLTSIATTAPFIKDGSPYNTLRLQAVQALLENATEKDVAAVCEFAPKESHAYTRACFYIYLARPGAPLVRELLLNALQDPDLTVKTRAIEGLKHYTDDSVTDRVLEFVEKTDQTRLRRAGIFMLKDRTSPRVRAAAETWAKDQDPEIQRWAAEALEKNKRSVSTPPERLLVGKWLEAGTTNTLIIEEGVAHVGPVLKMDYKVQGSTIVFQKPSGIRVNKFDAEVRTNGTVVRDFRFHKEGPYTNWVVTFHVTDKQLELHWDGKATHYSRAEP